MVEIEIKKVDNSGVQKFDQVKLVSNMGASFYTVYTLYRENGLLKFSYICIIKNCNRIL
jgi:hypothetical protein